MTKIIITLKCHCGTKLIIIKDLDEFDYECPVCKRLLLRRIDLIKGTYSIAVKKPVYQDEEGIIPDEEETV